MISYFYIYSFVVDLIFELISRSIFSFSSYDDEEEYEYEAENQNDIKREKYNNKDMFDMDEFHQEVERKRNEHRMEDDEDYIKEYDEEDTIGTLEEAIGKLDDIEKEEEIEEEKEIKTVKAPEISEEITEEIEEIDEIEIEMPRLDINPINAGFTQEFEQKRIVELEKKLKEKEKQLSVLEGKLELNKKVNIDEYGEGVVKRKDDIDDLSKSFKQKEIIDNIFEDIKNLYSSLDAKAKAIKEQEDILITRLDALEQKREEETEYEPSVRRRRRTRLTDAELIELTDKKLRKRNESKKINKSNYYTNVTNKKTESIIEDIEKIKMEISDMNKNTDVSYNYISEILHTNNSPFEDALLKKDKSDSDKTVKDIKQDIKDTDNITNIKTLQDKKEKELNINKKENDIEEKQNIKKTKEEQININNQSDINVLEPTDEEKIKKEEINKGIKANKDLEKSLESESQREQEVIDKKEEAEEINVNSVDFLPDDIINDFKNVSISEKTDTLREETKEDKQKEKREKKKKQDKKKAPKRKPKQPKKNDISNKDKKSGATDTDELLKPMLAELKREITPKLVAKKPLETNIIDFNYLSKSKLNVKKGDFEDISKLIDKM